MTRNGKAFALPTSALPTAGNASSSLLPTPEAKLADSGPDYARATRAGSGGDDLTTTLLRLLPTPTARDWKDGTSAGTVPTNALLGRQVWTLLPTPTASDSEGGHLTRSDGSQLLPGIARGLSLGESTARQSDGGKRHSAGRLPHQPTLDLEAGTDYRQDSWNG